MLWQQHPLKVPSLFSIISVSVSLPIPPQPIPYSCFIVCHMEIVKQIFHLLFNVIFFLFVVYLRIENSQPHFVFIEWHPKWYYKRNYSKLNSVLISLNVQYYIIRWWKKTFKIKWRFTTSCHSSHRKLKVKWLFVRLCRWFRCLSFFSFSNCVAVSFQWFLPLLNVECCLKF